MTQQYPDTNSSEEGGKGGREGKGGKGGKGGGRGGRGGGGEKGKREEGVISNMKHPPQKKKIK